MKAIDAVELNAWIVTNRDHLMSSKRGKMVDVAAAAERDLGFKVTTGNLATLMRKNGIETKRMSVRQSEKLAMLAEIERLTAEVKEMRQTLAKVAANDYIPDEIKDLVFGGLKREIREAIMAD